MISVIIPCRFSLPLLVEQLSALMRQRCDEEFEVIIADNTDNYADQLVLAGIVERYADHLPGLRIVDARGFTGAGHARNAAVRASRGNKIAFLDADDVAGNGWLAAISAALDRHHFVASRFDIDLLNTPEIRAGRKNNQGKRLQSYTNPHFLSHAGGCGMGVTRAAFDAVGGFDERFHLLEDTELSWRLQLRGFELVFVPEALVHVRFRPTARGSFRQSFGYGMYNVLLYKEYRHKGMPAIERTSMVIAGYQTARYLLALRDRNRRGNNVRALGHLLGRMAGSVAFVVWGF